MEKNEKDIINTVICDNPEEQTLIPTDDIIPTPVDVPGTPECGAGCPENSVVTVANIFGTLQECVTITWRLHLKTRKHHIHVTLNEFYDKALGIRVSMV